RHRQRQQRGEDHRHPPARKRSGPPTRTPGRARMTHQDTPDTAVAEPAPARFDQLQPEFPGDAADLNLDVILDVPVSLSLEVGRTRMPIRQLLQLNRGSVIELERGAGEPLDVYVNGTLIAHGEVVVINDRFGVRLTDVVSPSER